MEDFLKMTYPNYAGQNMYYPQFQGNIYNPHPSYFANAMQQNYNPQPQSQSQRQNQQQENITTQPPIIQSALNMINSKMTPVSNKDEAMAAQVDLVYGTPSFFHNKSQNEIYLKQFDVSDGAAIFKTYVEKPIEVEEKKEEQIIKPDYEGELHYISEGIDNLHRMQADLKQTIESLKYSIKETEDVIDVEPEPIKIKGKKHA